jgi:hypothetical protein
LLSGTYEFQGFSPVFPFWLLLLLLVVTVVITIISYRHYISFSIKQKATIIGLRITAYFVLLILLTNPVYIHVTNLIQKPKVAILIDNSASISVEKGNWSGIESMREFLSNLLTDETKDYEYTLLGFGSSIRDIENPESLSFDEGTTDLDRVITEVLNRDQFDQIILISDGISTRGRDPIYSGLNSMIPVTTIAVGDTSSQNDIVLVNIDHPTVSYIDAVSRISATVRNEGFIDESVQIGLYQNSSPIQSKIIRFDQIRSTQQVIFDLESKSEGQQQYEVRVSTLPGEWNIDNNDRTFTIDVLDNRIRVLHLAFELHPDVGAIRNVLFDNESIYLNERTWIEGNRFIEGPLPGNRDTLDVVVIHGYPDVTSQELSLAIRELTINKPFVFILTPGTSLSRLQSVIPTATHISQPQPLRNSVIQLSTASSASGHVITQLDEIDWGRSPNVNMSVNVSKNETFNQPIISGLNRNTGLTQPVLTISQNSTYRNSFILFNGFYAWFLAEEQYRVAMAQILTNVITWSATDNREDLFQISTSENEYSLSDEIIFNARVRNESGAPESSATISLQLFDYLGNISNFTLIPEGLGNYSLNIPTLPIGSYRYEAKADKERTELGFKEGFFTIGRTTIEFVETRRNDRALKSIADNSGGQFFVYNEVPTINDLILMKNDGNDAQTIRETKLMNRNPIWFILLIILVSFEWFLRKKLLLP